MIKLPSVFYNKYTRLFVGIVLILSLYFLVFLRIDFFLTANLKLLDAIYRFSHNVKPLPASIEDIVMISIDDRSASILNRRLPWDRSIFSECLTILKGYNPKIIAMDVVFVGESRDPAIDEELAAAIEKSGNVILASYFSPRGEYIRPHRMFADISLGYGFINKPRDKDLIIRSTRAVVYNLYKRNEVIDYSFSIKTLCGFLDVPIENVEVENKKILLRKDDGTLAKKIPLGHGGIFPLKFRARLNDFKVVPIYKVIREDFAKDLFRGKIVIIGSAAEIHHDVYSTPLRLMHGPVINANELLVFLEDDFVHIIPWYLQLSALLLIGLLTALYAHRLPPLYGLYITVGQIIALSLLSVFLVFKGFHARYFDFILICVMSYISVNTYKYVRLTVESIALKTQAVTDGLTGLFVFRYFELRLQNELNKAKAMNQKLTLVMADIDHFKNINDTYGHTTGNTVLIQIAKTLMESARKSDVVCRYGGEEFAIIMVNTSAENSLHYTERITNALKEIDFMTLCGIKTITLSFGVATFPDHGISTSKELIECSDKALYHAKQTGRNRTCIFNPQLLSGQETPQGPANST